MTTNKKDAPKGVHARALLGVENTYLEEFGRVTIKNEQHLTPQFMDTLKDSRNESDNVREGNYQRVASIPTSVHEQWLREGFDLYQHPIKTIVRRLKAQNLDYFMTTNKQI